MAKSDDSSSSSSSDSEIRPSPKMRFKGPPPPPKTSNVSPSPSQSILSFKKNKASLASETIVSEIPELPKMPFAKLSSEIPMSPPVILETFKSATKTSSLEDRPPKPQKSVHEPSIKFKNSLQTSSLKDRRPKPAKSVYEPSASMIQKKDSGRVETKNSIIREEVQKDPALRRQLQEELEKNLRPEIERQVERELRPQLERTIKAEVEANIRKNLEQEYEIKRRDMEQEHENKVRKNVVKEITTLKEKWDEDMKKAIGKHQHEIELKNMEIKQKHDEKDHEVKQAAIKLQAMTESVKTLSTSISQMKEINDTLKKSLREMEDKCQMNQERVQAATAKSDSMLYQLNTMIPIKEAKRLAFRALTKGRAVEVLYRVGLMSSIITQFRKDAFLALTANAHGENFANSLQQRGKVTERLIQNDISHAKFQEFRREQMWLLSENERLMQKVLKLQRPH